MKHKKKAKPSPIAKPSTTAKPKGGVPAPATGGLMLGNWERATDRFFDRLFDEFRRWPSLLGMERMLPRPELTMRIPPVDVYEDGNTVVVKVEIPGMNKEDIDLTVTPDMLTIKGEKKKEKEVKERDYHRFERSYGSFSRTIALPVEVKGDGAKADFKDGVLTVRLPKSEAVKREKIEVKAV